MLHGKKILGVCIPRIHTPSANEFIETLSEGLKPHGYCVFAYTTCSDLYWNTPNEAGEKTVFELLDFNVIDALVINCENFKDTALINDIIRRAHSHDVPVITFGAEYEGCTALQFNYRVGMEKMVRHVVEDHGCRDLHFMAGFMGNPYSEERIDVFKKVIAEYGISFSEDMVSYGDFWSAPTIEATEKLIAENRVPEAMICANDTMALNVCTVMAKHGIRVPEDIIVTGFDGTNDGQITRPTIATCTCSNAALASEVVRLVSEGLTSESSSVNTIAPPLEPAQSCGCVKDVVTNLSEHLAKLNDRFYRYQGDENCLFDMSARIINCSGLQEIHNILGKQNFYDFTCVLRRECADNAVNPMQYHESNTENLILLFDTDVPLPFEPYSFHYSEIFPNLPAQLEMGDPVIFSALNFLNIPLGYVSFHFHNYDLDNYYSIPQAVNMLNNSIGCFRNMRYQQYLGERMEELYAHDHLTGLFNRNALVNYFEENAERFRRGTESITFILCDLDRLKYINDTFGHDEGDFAISAVSDALRLAIPQNSIVARWGGDEIVALFTGGFDEQAMREKISGNLNEIAQKKPYDITASLGVFTVEPDGLTSLDELTKAADRLMYEEKLLHHKSREN